MSDTEAKSDLAKAIEDCERKARLFQARLFLDKDRASKVNGKFRIRVAKVAELQNALDDCAAYIKRYAKDAAYESDPDYTVNLRTAYILHRVCIRESNDLPAWESPK